MATEITRYVTYYIVQQSKPSQRRTEELSSNVHNLFSTNNNNNPIIESQRIVTDNFIQARQPYAQVIDSFIEETVDKKNNKWPSLKQALNRCRETNATLLIAELGTTSSNEAFTQLLLESQIRFHCCDQPFVDKTILEALFKHAQVQRVYHGKLIRQGLKNTSAKSGNPNAAAVINKVNKPKIDTAIVFAFLLQPIISDYRRKGFSQRQMVKTLNEEGFTAPEGGKWVLSQLQKVLERVKLNEVATELTPLIDDLLSKDYTHAQISEELNNKAVTPLKRTAWNESQVKKLIDRIEQINDIIAINKFVKDLIPIISTFKDKGLSDNDIIGEFESAGIPIRYQSENAA